MGLGNVLMQFVDIFVISPAFYPVGVAWLLLGSLCILANRVVLQAYHSGATSCKVFFCGARTRKDLKIQIGGTKIIAIVCFSCYFCFLLFFFFSVVIPINQ